MGRKHLSPRQKRSTKMNKNNIPELDAVIKKYIAPDEVSQAFLDFKLEYSVSEIVRKKVRVEKYFDFNLAVNVQGRPTIMPGEHQPNTNSSSETDEQIKRLTDAFETRTPDDIAAKCNEILNQPYLTLKKFESQEIALYSYRHIETCQDCNGSRLVECIICKGTGEVWNQFKYPKQIFANGIYQRTDYKGGWENCGCYDGDVECGGCNATGRVTHQKTVQVQLICNNVGTSWKRPEKLSWVDQGFNNNSSFKQQVDYIFSIDYQPKTKIEITAIGGWKQTTYGAIEVVDAKVKVSYYELTNISKRVRFAGGKAYDLDNFFDGFVDPITEVITSKTLFTQPKVTNKQLLSTPLVEEILSCPSSTNLGEGEVSDAKLISRRSVNGLNEYFNHIVNSYKNKRSHLPVSLIAKFSAKCFIAMALIFLGIDLFSSAKAPWQDVLILKTIFLIPAFVMKTGQLLLSGDLSSLFSIVLKSTPFALIGLYYLGIHRQSFSVLRVCSLYIVCIPIGAALSQQLLPALSGIGFQLTPVSISQLPFTFMLAFSILFGILKTRKLSFEMTRNYASLHQSQALQKALS